MNQFEFDKGYRAYCEGKKIHAWATQSFVEGWWAANENREMFGEFESFLEAE